MAKESMEWLEAIANRANVDVARVEQVLTARHIVPTPVLPAPRRMKLLSISFGGVKHEVVDEGPYVFEWNDLDEGLWGMMTDRNLRGKSSKREMQDASFDFLAQSYAGQTTEYQNVSIRLGFLLALDLTEAKRGGTPHIRSLVECRRIFRKGEAEPRHIVVVKVPGRRFLPSAMSASAKSPKNAAKPKRKPSMKKETNG